MEAGQEGLVDDHAVLALLHLLELAADVHVGADLLHVPDPNVCHRTVVGVEAEHAVLAGLRSHVEGQGIDGRVFGRVARGRPVDDRDRHLGLGQVAREVDQRDVGGPRSGLERGTDNSTVDRAAEPGRKPLVHEGAVGGLEVDGDVDRLANRQ